MCFGKTAVTDPYLGFGFDVGFFLFFFFNIKTAV